MVAVKRRECVDAIQSLALAVIVEVRLLWYAYVKQFVGAPDLT